MKPDCGFVIEVYLNNSVQHILDLESLSYQVPLNIKRCPVGQRLLVDWIIIPA